MPNLTSTLCRARGLRRLRSSSCARWDAGELGGCGVGVAGAAILSASAHGSGSQAHLIGGFWKPPRPRHGDRTDCFAVGSSQRHVLHTPCSVKLRVYAWILMHLQSPVPPSLSSSSSRGLGGAAGSCSQWSFVVDRPPAPVGAVPCAGLRLQLRGDRCCISILP